MGGNTAVAAAIRLIGGGMNEKKTAPDCKKYGCKNYKIIMINDPHTIYGRYGTRGYNAECDGCEFDKKEEQASCDHLAKEEQAK